MDFAELVNETLEINNKFENKLGKQGRMLDLVEEVGELANAMLMVDGNKQSGNPDRQRTKEDIADALADIFFDIIILAKHYEVDLGNEYKTMLARMRVRFTDKDLV